MTGVHLIHSHRINIHVGVGIDMYRYTLLRKNLAYIKVFGLGVWFLGVTWSKT